VDHHGTHEYDPVPEGESGNKAANQGMGNVHLPPASWHVVCLWVAVDGRVHNHGPFVQETSPMAESHDLTLLDVIQAVSEVAENDQEIIAAVVHLVSSGQV
jgi:hypothetical protein